MLTQKAGLTDLNRHECWTVLGHLSVCAQYMGKLFRVGCVNGKGVGFPRGQSGLTPRHCCFVYFLSHKFVYLNYCLTKISVLAKRSIPPSFFLFIVPSPFFVHCPYKGRINRAESVLTGLKPY